MKLGDKQDIVTWDTISKSYEKQYKKKSPSRVKNMQILDKKLKL